MKNLTIHCISFIFAFLPFSNSFAQADLRVTNVQGLPNVITPGEVVYYTFDLVNDGTEVAWGSYTIRKYLSSDQSFDQDDIEVGYVPTGNTPIGTIENVVGAVAIPESISFNNVHLIFVVDADEQIQESNETNNVFRFGSSVSVQYPYLEASCQSNFGFDQSFLCHSNIDNGYEIYTEGNDGILKHIVDYNGNILSSEIHDIKTRFSIDNEERLLNEIDDHRNVIINSTPLPDYLFDDHPDMQVVKLMTGEYVFYYRILIYPPLGFSSQVILIKTNESFEQIALYDDIFNDSNVSNFDRIEGVFPTDEGGFFVDYLYNLPTWQNYYYSYLVEYDAEGNHKVVDFAQAYTVELERTPCGVKRIYSQNYSSVYSGGQDENTYWNNNAFTRSVSNTSSGRFGAFRREGSFTNTNIKTRYDESHNGITIPFTIWVNDGDEEYTYQNDEFSASYLLKGQDFTFLSLKTIDGYLTISQYPCASDCETDTEEIESLNFTHLGSFENSEYYLSNTRENMYNINAFSDEYGYNLAIINTEEENEFISQKLWDMSYIGLNDAQQEGVLEWNSNEVVSYSNFDTDCFFCGTNNEQNDHVVMNQWNGKWSWANAWSKRPYVIEVSCGEGRPAFRKANPNNQTETASNQSIEIFPNPSTDIINLRILGELSSTSRLEIYNSTGKRIFTYAYELQQINEVFQVDVSQFLSGIYFTKMMIDGVPVIKKFVKE